jgi:uncharacterized protein YjbI with pentapeptide repeats
VNFSNSADFNKATFSNLSGLINASFSNSADFNKATFSNSSNFINVDFNSANFSESNFNLSGFENVTFNELADFSKSTFNDSILFAETNFSYANFSETTFNDYVTFKNVNFSYANFDWTTFNGIMSFGSTAFSISFNGANFKNYADFSEATFKYADFRGTNFNDSSLYFWPKTPEHIYPDKENIYAFTRYYEHIGRYDHADDLYYNYRYIILFQKLDNFQLDTSFWTDVLSFVTCGFGVNYFNTIYCSFGIIILFFIFYTNPLAILRCKGKGLSLKNAGIEKDDKRQEISLFDIFYFSICTFTFISHDRLYPKSNFRILVALEGCLGWILLGIFIATFSHALIRI